MPSTARGVAYGFWASIENRRRELGLSLTELHKRSGVARSTIDKLRSGTKPPTLRVIHALADVVQLEHREAERLAGIEPITLEGSADSSSDVRAAILASSSYTRDQKDMLLSMVETIERANAAGGTSPGNVQ
jgi:transcriptional regulator with XRE-family HTH domain